MRRIAFASLLVACSRASSPAATDASPTASASALGSATVAAEAGSPNKGPSHFEGTYASKPGSLYVPEGAEYKGAQWRGDDAGDGVGSGTLVFTVDPATGRIEGKGEGSLGQVVLAGVLANDGVVSFAIGRASPLDGGFTGAAIGKLSGDKIEGTMRLSRALADAIREATFTMTRK
jgi:streptogramin lyase